MKPAAGAEIDRPDEQAQAPPGGFELPETGIVQDGPQHRGDRGLRLGPDGAQRGGRRLRARRRPQHRVDELRGQALGLLGRYRLRRRRGAGVHEIEDVSRESGSRRRFRRLGSALRSLGLQGGLERAGELGIGAQLLERRANGLERSSAPRELLDLLSEFEELGDRRYPGREPLGPEILEVLEGQDRADPAARNLDRGSDLPQQRVERILVDGTNARRTRHAGREVGDDDEVERRLGLFH